MMNVVFCFYAANRVRLENIYLLTLVYGSPGKEEQLPTRLSGGCWGAIFCVSSEPRPGSVCCRLPFQGCFVETASEDRTSLARADKEFCLLSGEIQIMFPSWAKTGQACCQPRMNDWRFLDSDSSAVRQICCTWPPCDLGAGRTVNFKFTCLLCHEQYILCPLSNGHVPSAGIPEEVAGLLVSLQVG